MPRSPTGYLDRIGIRNRRPFQPARPNLIASKVAFRHPMDDDVTPALNSPCGHDDILTLVLCLGF
jgi:hypothetical protein